MSLTFAAMLRPLQRLYLKLVSLLVRDLVGPMKSPRQAFVLRSNRVKAGGRVVFGLLAGMAFPVSIENRGMLPGSLDRELRPAMEVE